MTQEQSETLTKFAQAQHAYNGAIEVYKQGEQGDSTNLQKACKAKTLVNQYSIEFCNLVIQELANGQA